MRLFSIRRWRARELVLSWVLYWVALFVVRLGPAALAIWRVTQGPDTDSSTVNFNASDKGGGELALTVARAGVTTWSGSIHLLTLALLIAGPPLAAWLLWATTRQRAEGAREVV